MAKNLVKYYRRRQTLSLPAFWLRIATKSVLNYDINFVVIR